MKKEKSMENKIYSRRRIVMPRWRKFYKKGDDQRKRKILKFFLIILIALLTGNIILQAIKPVIEKQCETMAKSIATKISNEQATIVMSHYKYTDLCTITKDDNGNIDIISLIVISVNEIISDVGVKIQEELYITENSVFSVPLGTFLGSKLLAGRGPQVKVRMCTIGSVLTDLKSEFSSAGINQTMHRIYLEVKCTVIVLTPFETMEEEITNQVLLAEAVIVGTTPNTYYNLEGMTTEGLVDVIE